MLIAQFLLMGKYMCFSFLSSIILDFNDDTIHKGQQ
jgi:hypothetical protein